jgi:hypothetical protein
MSPEEFLANPQAQDTVFKTKFGQYKQKYGPEGAARAWFAGEGGMNNPNAKDSLGTSVSSYASQFDKNMGGNSAEAPASAAITAAVLRGGGQPAAQPVAGKAPAPSSMNPMPAPNSTGIFYDPRLINPGPQYNEGQVRGALANPYIPEEVKTQIQQQYNQQAAPIELPWPGGHVLIDRHNPQNQQFIPDLQKGTVKAGDIETPQYGTVGPTGSAPGVQFNPMPRAPSPTVGPQSRAAPAVAPAGGPAVPIPPGAAPTTQNASVAPAGPANGPIMPPESVKPAPVQVASLDPTAGTAQAAAQAGSKPSVSPEAAPAVEGAKPIPVAANVPQPDAPASTPLGQLSAHDEAIKALVGPEVWDASQQAKDAQNARDLRQHEGLNKLDVEKTAQDDTVKNAAKKYDTMATAGQAARKQMPNIDLALAMMNNPNMHTGLLSGAQDTWSRFKAAALGDTYANAPNEAFDKIMAATVLGGIKDVGGGQIRNAEIQLLGKANANRNNTDASNRAVLEVTRRAYQTTDHLDDLGQQYASGDEVHDPVTGDLLLKANTDSSGEIAPRHGLDVGYDKLARKFMLDHPSFTPDEIKHYQTIFDTGRDPDQVSPPPEAIKQLKAGTNTPFQNGQVWTLGADGKPQRVN